MHKNTFLVLIIVFFAAIPGCKKNSGPVNAIPGAVVNFIVGDVSISSEDKTSRKAKLNELAKMSEIIITGKSSHADLQFSESVLVRVQENTRLKIEDAVFGERKQTKLHLEGGKVLVVSPKLKQAVHFKITTKAAVAGVRGTEFSVTDSEGGSVVLIKDGQLQINSSKAGENSDVGAVIGEPDQKVTVNNDGKIKTEPATEEDKKEFDGPTIAGIKEGAQEQINSIIANFEQERERIRATLDEQKERNAKELDDLKAKNEKELQDLKDKNNAMKNEIKDNASGQKDEIKNKASGDVNDVKKASGQADEIKKAGTNDSGKSALDELKNKNKGMTKP
ncbi:MAG TPA: FecR domain-containing protein [Leptospiraceae bacterium]|nr:FecR domain-containing protein [Leptospiraceae bacterium]